jgi:hypothetical protein
MNLMSTIGEKVLRKPGPNSDLFFVNEESEVQNQGKDSSKTRSQNSHLFLANEESQVQNRGKRFLENQVPIQIFFL